MVKKIAKYLLNSLPGMTVLPILSGRLFGKKWYIHSGVYSNWTGKYEKEKVEVFSKLVKKGDCVIDAGAHVGYYSLLASCLSGNKGHVYSFEPVKNNFNYLKFRFIFNLIEHILVILIERIV